LSEKTPFFLLALLFTVVGYISQGSGGGLSDIPASYSFLNRLFFIPYSISFYMVYCIIPYNLSVLHYYPEVKNGFLPFEYYLSLVFVILIIGLIVWKSKNRKYLLSGFLFFIITILPVLQIIPIGKVIVSERYTYFPYTGLFIIIFTFLYNLYEKNKSIGSYFYIVLAIFSVYYSVLTWNRVKVWQNGVTLWSDFITDNPDYYYGYYGLAGANYSKEISNYNRYVRRYKTDVIPYGGLEVSKDNWDNVQGAIKNFSKTILLNPKFADAYLGRGNAYLDMNILDRALADYDKVLELNPRDQRAYNNRATTNYKLKKYDQAIDDYNKLLSLNELNSVTYFNRGLLYMTKQDTARACEDFKKARSLKHRMAGQFIEKLCK
jgi:protein O-mannosyl-transferase